MTWVQHICSSILLYFFGLEQENLLICYIAFNSEHWCVINDFTFQTCTRDLNDVGSAKPSQCAQQCTNYLNFSYCGKGWRICDVFLVQCRTTATTTSECVCAWAYSGVPPRFSEHLGAEHRFLFGYMSPVSGATESAEDACRRIQLDPLQETRTRIHSWALCLQIAIPSFLSGWPVSFHFYSDHIR